MESPFKTLSNTHNPGACYYFKDSKEQKQPDKKKPNSFKKDYFDPPDEEEIIKKKSIPGPGEYSLPQKKLANTTASCFKSTSPRFSQEKNIEEKRGVE